MPSLFPLEVNQLVSSNRHKLDQFQFHPFVVNRRISSTYADWWKSVSARAFTSPPKHYLSKLIGGSRGKPSQPPRLSIETTFPSVATKPMSKSTSSTIHGKYLTLQLIQCS